MSDITLIFDFMIDIWQSAANVIMNNFILTFSFSLVILKIIVDVLYKIRIKFF